MKYFVVIIIILIVKKAIFPNEINISPTERKALWELHRVTYNTADTKGRFQRIWGGEKGLEHQWSEVTFMAENDQYCVTGLDLSKLFYQQSLIGAVFNIVDKFEYCYCREG